ncbi:hypothetical protein HDU86_003703 [Geranomyces michiganensis]|nr:hypothetical protein HDU86_003703 [Geranomyces michiganensis]
MLFARQLVSLSRVSAAIVARKDLGAAANVRTSAVLARRAATATAPSRREFSSSPRSLNSAATANVAEVDKVNTPNTNKSDQAAAGAEPPVNVYNEKLASLFHTLAERAEDKFVRAGFKRVASEFERYPRSVTSGLMASKEIPGVGKAYAEYIDNFLKTGEVPEVKTKTGKIKQRVKVADGTNIVQTLTQIVGLGEKGARKLMEFYNVESIDDVISRVPANELTGWQFAGVKYYEDFKQTISRSEMETWENKIRDAAKAVDPAIEVEFAGSYRCGEPNSDKIIVHMYNKELSPRNRDSWKKGGAMLEKMIEALKQDNYIVHDVTHHPGQTNYSGVCRLDENSPHRRIFINMNSADMHWYRLFMDTGSTKFHRRMKVAADRKGYSLRKEFIEDSRGLFVTHLSSEEELFKFLDVEYAAPSARDA